MTIYHKLSSDLFVTTYLEMGDKVAVHASCSLVVSLTDLAPSDSPLLTVHEFLSDQVKVLVFDFGVHSVLVLQFHCPWGTQDTVSFNLKHLINIF